jgi:hypothetical protein
MKTKVLALAVILAAVTVSPAYEQEVYLGFEGGANFAYLNGPDVSPLFGSRLGVVAGGFAHVGLFPGLALQPELLYAQKGAQTSDGRTVYQLNYVEIPVLAEVSLGLPVVNPGIIIGPAFDGNVMTSGLQNVNPVDVGVIGGLQFHFDPILVSGRYEMGLTDVTSDKNMQNGNFTFLVGVAFI